MPVQSNVVLNQMPPWLEAAQREIVERGQGLSRQPFLPFPGPGRIAPLNQDLLRAETLGRQEGLYMPYLQQSARGYRDASQPFYQNYQNYMNPYQNAVLDRIRTEGLRTFNEGIMPSLSARFIQGGHYGGGIHRGLAERAARDVQQQIGDRQQQALASGYQQAGQLHATDSARQLEAARRFAELGQARQAGHLADISALESQGERARGIRQQDLDVGYRDYLRQNEYPWQQLSNLGGAISGSGPYASQGLQYYQTPGQAEPNRAGQIGALAGQLYGLNRGLARGQYKKGGSVGTTLTMQSGLATLKRKKK